MRWNPYIDLRIAISNAVRTKCRVCEVEIGQGDLRAELIPVIGKKELCHVDCAAKRAPDHAARKVKDKDPDLAPEVLEVLARYVPEGTEPSPRHSYLRTPLLNLSYPQTPPSTRPCLFCGNDCPGPAGPALGHAIRAYSIDGERRFHPQCVLQLAPGLCARVVAENSPRWPEDVKALFKAALPAGLRPTPRSPWQDTGGIPKLERAPSGRAACRYCDGKIQKGELRLAREKIFGMRRSPAYFHVGCFCMSDDYHPKLLEIVVLKIDPALAPDVTREEIAAWGPLIPGLQPGEDDDAPSTIERLLFLFDSVPREAPPTDAPESKLTENVVEFPRGFFSSE
ncbi:MAG: PARP-type zinc finger-containing protein [Planctomycetota bacterium]